MLCQVVEKIRENLELITGLLNTIVLPKLKAASSHWMLGAQLVGFSQN